MSGCISLDPRIVKVSPPGTATEENSYRNEPVYLTQFSISKNAIPEDQTVDELKRQFLDYLRRTADFKDAVDATGSGAAVPEKALRMKVELQPDLQGGDINIMAGYYELFLLYSFSPRKGSVSVAGTTTLLRGRRSVSTKTWTAKEPFSYSFFGLFRSGPILEAFKDAYEEVFNHIVVPTGSEGGLSTDEIAEQVERTLEAAKKGKEFHSDVDNPSYGLAENSENYAIVVGIEKYQQIASADFGERDAQVVKEHLLALGFPQRNIVHLSGDMATRSNLEKYLESWLPAHVKENSRVVFYFSGHGAPDVDSKQAFLVPWDGDTKFLQKTGFPTKKLYDDLNALSAKRIIVMLDSCFSGAGGRSVLPQGARPLMTKIDEGTTRTGRVVVLSAAESDEISLSDDKQGHGLFTYYLLKGLNERKGQGSVKDLYNYLVPHVQDAARQQNRDQTPKLVAGDAALAALPLGE